MDQPDLKIRSFPFNYQKVMAHPNISYQWLIKGENKAAIIDQLGSSVSLEMSEQIFFHLKRDHQFYNSKRGADFIAQERTHSAYHKILNSKLIDPVYEKNDLLGSIARVAHPIFQIHREPWFHMFKANPQDMYLKKLVLRRGAVFESIVGFVMARLMFETWAQSKPSDFAEKSPWHYLWYYHATEESEHLEEAFREYEEVFQEEVFSPKNFVECLRDIDDGTRQLNHCVFNVAATLNEQITIKEIMNLPHRKRMGQIVREHLIPGFDPRKYREERLANVAKWETEIEPTLRAHVLKLYAADEKKSA